MRNDEPMKLTFAAGTRRQALLSKVDLASVRKAASNQEERGGPVVDPEARSRRRPSH
jgi:hypothetical protein